MTIPIEGIIIAALILIAGGWMVCSWFAAGKITDLESEAHVARGEVVREKSRADEAEHFLISLTRYNDIRIKRYAGGKTYRMDYQVRGRARTERGSTAWMDSPRVCIINAEAKTRPRGSRR